MPSRCLCPQQHATAAAEELIRLCVQTGHDPAACRRFLKKSIYRASPAPTSPFCVVCVHPCLKGLLHSPFIPSSSRGTGADLPIQSSEAMAFRWMSGLINHLYLQITTLQFFRRCSLNFIVLHAIPHTLFQLLATARNLQPALIFPSLSAVKLKLLFKNLQVDSAFLQFSHSFIPGLSYWAKLCPSVSCYAFSLGCIA